MENFEYRRDRYELFAQFDNPLVNLSLELDLPDFRPFCKARGLPPFHFLLYCVLTSATSLDNFMYRIYAGEVIKIDGIIASYTVINIDNNLNYASFEMSANLEEFVARSVAAGKAAQASRAMINTTAGQSERERRNHIYITCLPWFKLNAIEHPIFQHKHADIPSIAWGKFGAPEKGRTAVPFSVQAHHGFVDGFHVHQLTERIAATVAALIA
ncbi:MAG: CatA-like O-acetyltransferase [Pseudomonadota bacterium]